MTRTSSRILLPAGVAGLLVLAGACGDDGSDAPEAATETVAAATEAPAAGTEPPAATEAPATTEAPGTTAASDDTSDGGLYGPETEPDSAAGEATVATADSDLGEILVDGEGMTLYLFMPDDQGPSTCTDDCLENWPALPGPAAAGEGIDESLLGTAARPDDDSEQATYDGWPLYYFANDEAPGDVTGQGVGDVWFVVDAAGAPVSSAPSETAAGETVMTAESDLGTILVDGQGITLYLFMPDGQGPSTCTDDCLASWPALAGPVTAGEGVDESLLGTATRPDDDSEQATYNGWPLYYFANDEAPGDTNGQGLGDVWFVLDAAGEAIPAS